MTRIAVLQMTAGIDPAANFATVAKAARGARRGEAQMLFTPEMTLLLDRDRTRAAASIVSEDDDRWVAEFAELARETGLYLAIGSIAVRKSNGMLANRSLFFAPDGSIAGQYDKIHMFDVDLSGGESWRESGAYESGRAVASVDDTPIGRLGLTICYDVRFPALFDALGRRMCDAIAVPSAFTVPTGKAHWHLLLRARAVEASAWVIAAAQVGVHEDGRQTFGHSLVVDPWGDVVLEMGDGGPALGFADIDPRHTAEVRAQLPSLANKRTFAI